MAIGKLKEVELRDIWRHEEYDFSKWLAKEENISELGEILGLSLIDVETEKQVGSFSCDIYCKDEFSDKKVIIENQLEATDHRHLGEILTYASGLDASIVVWIVKEARSEHARAVEWLNEHFDSDVSFFLIEVHAYKIGDSDPAPQFKVIEQPNDFAVQVKKNNKAGEKFNQTMNYRLDFWTKFNEAIAERNNPFNKRKPTTDHWYDVSIGSSKCHLGVGLINKDSKINVYVWVNDSKEQYDELYSHKDEIEALTGCSYVWNRNDNKKSSSITASIPGLDFEHQDNYNDLMNQTIDLLIKLRTAVKPYLI
ncbi:MAG: DUF4268 domain-containing protein [Clostridiales bacterium]|nr:DUF4268 domain-containing protein [Clostridiales bacterium]